MDVAGQIMSAHMDFHLRTGAGKRTCRLAQFRTCLWLRAGIDRAADSGSVEGKPVTGVRTGSKPLLKRRTRLKATT